MACMPSTIPAWPAPAGSLHAGRTQVRLLSDDDLEPVPVGRPLCPVPSPLRARQLVAGVTALSGHRKLAFRQYVAEHTHASLALWLWPWKRKHAGVHTVFHIAGASGTSFRPSLSIGVGVKPDHFFLGVTRDNGKLKGIHSRSPANFATWQHVVVSIAPDVAPAPSRDDVNSMESGSGEDGVSGDWMDQWRGNMAVRLFVNGRLEATAFVQPERQVSVGRRRRLAGQAQELLRRAAVDASVVVTGTSALVLPRPPRHPPRGGPTRQTRTKAQPSSDDVGAGQQVPEAWMLDDGMPGGGVADPFEDLWGYDADDLAAESDIPEQEIAVASVPLLAGLTPGTLNFGQSAEVGGSPMIIADVWEFTGSPSTSSTPRGPLIGGVVPGLASGAMDEAHAVFLASHAAPPEPPAWCLALAAAPPSKAYVASLATPVTSSSRSVAASRDHGERVLIPVASSNDVSSALAVRSTFCDSAVGANPTPADVLAWLASAWNLGRDAAKEDGLSENPESASLRDVRACIPPAMLKLVLARLHATVAEEASAKQTHQLLPRSRQVRFNVFAGQAERFVASLGAARHSVANWMRLLAELAWSDSLLHLEPDSVSPPTPSSATLEEARWLWARLWRLPAGSSDEVAILATPFGSIPAAAQAGHAWATTPALARALVGHTLDSLPGPGTVRQGDFNVATPARHAMRIMSRLRAHGVSFLASAAAARLRLDSNGLPAVGAQSLEKWPLLAHGPHPPSVALEGAGAGHAGAAHFGGCVGDADGSSSPRRLQLDDGSELVSNSCRRAMNLSALVVGRRRGFGGSASRDEAVSFAGNCATRLALLLPAAIVAHNAHHAKSSSAGLKSGGGGLLEQLERTRFRGQHGLADEVNEARRAGAERGDPDATAWLARQYYWGQGGLPRDRARAAELFGRAAELGNAEAAFNLGVMHLDGEAAMNGGNGGGGRRDAQAAHRRFRQAADLGYAPAQAGLAQSYFSGNAEAGVERDAAEAVRLLRAAAANGSQDGAFNLAQLYRKGNAALPADAAQAIELYGTAMLLGGDEASAHLAEGVGTVGSWVDKLAWGRAAGGGRAGTDKESPAAQTRQGDGLGSDPTSRADALAAPGPRWLPQPQLHVVPASALLGPDNLPLALRVPPPRAAPGTLAHPATAPVPDLLAAWDASLRLPPDMRRDGWLGDTTADPHGHRQQDAHAVLRAKQGAIPPAERFVTVERAGSEHRIHRIPEAVSCAASELLSVPLLRLGPVQTVSRAALEAFLAGDATTALAWYELAAGLGDDTATANVAHILDQAAAGKLELLGVPGQSQPAMLESSEAEAALGLRSKALERAEALEKARAVQEPLVGESGSARGGGSASQDATKPQTTGGSSREGVHEAAEESTAAQLARELGTRLLAGMRAQLLSIRRLWRGAWLALWSWGAEAAAMAAEVTFRISSLQRRGGGGGQFPGASDAPSPKRRRALSLLPSRASGEGQGAAGGQPGRDEATGPPALTPLHAARLRDAAALLTERGEPTAVVGPCLVSAGAVRFSAAHHRSPLRSALRLSLGLPALGLPGRAWAEATAALHSAVAAHASASLPHSKRAAAGWVQPPPPRLARAAASARLRCASLGVPGCYETAATALLSGAWRPQRAAQPSRSWTSWLCRQSSAHRLLWEASRRLASPRALFLLGVQAAAGVPIPLLDRAVRSRRPAALPASRGAGGGAWPDAARLAADVGAETLIALADRGSASSRGRSLNCSASTPFFAAAAAAAAGTPFLGLHGDGYSLGFLRLAGGNRTRSALLALGAASQLSRGQHANPVDWEALLASEQRFPLAGLAGRTQRGARVGVATDDMHEAGWLPSAVASRACRALEAGGETGRRLFIQWALLGSGPAAAEGGALDRDAGTPPSASDVAGVLLRAGLVVSPARDAEEDAMLDRLCATSSLELAREVDPAATGLVRDFDAAENVLEDALGARRAEKEERGAHQAATATRQRREALQVQDVIPPAAEVALIGVLAAMLAAVLWLRHARRVAALQRRRG